MNPDVSGEHKYRRGQRARAVVDRRRWREGERESERRGRNRGDESSWKGRKHEAGMTSLGLTFHSRPTPALCILTSLRCVSYILYLSPSFLRCRPCCCLFPGRSSPSLHPSPPARSIARLDCFFREQKERKNSKIQREVAVRASHPRDWLDRGLLVSSRFRQQM